MAWTPCSYIVLSRNEVESSRNIMASLSRGAPPRQNEKAKSIVLDLGLDVLDLEGHGPWGMITAIEFKK